MVIESGNLAVLGVGLAGRALKGAISKTMPFGHVGPVADLEPALASAVRISTCAVSACTACCTLQQHTSFHGTPVARGSGH